MKSFKIKAKDLKIGDRFSTYHRLGEGNQPYAECKVIGITLYQGLCGEEIPMVIYKDMLFNEIGVASFEKDVYIFPNRKRSPYD